MAFKWTWNWILQKNIKILAEKKPFFIFLSTFPEKKPGFWLNFRQYLTKFRLDLTIFFCIIKHCHPPSWRLCGPETGFCPKKYQNFDQISHFLFKFDHISTKIDKIWSKFDKILTEFDKIAVNVIWPNNKKIRAVNAGMHWRGQEALLLFSSSKERQILFGQIASFAFFPLKMVWKILLSKFKVCT